MDSASSETNSGKRKKIELTFDQKREICSFYQENIKMTHEQITHYFSRRYGLNLSRSTISSLLKRSSEILSMPGDESRLRNRTAKYPELEDALYSWFLDRLDQNAHVSDALIAEETERLAAALQLNNFKASNGWLQNFKNRYGIMRKRSAQNNSLIETAKNTSKFEADSSEMFEDRDSIVFLIDRNPTCKLEPEIVPDNVEYNQANENLTSIVEYLRSSEVWTDEVCDAVELLKRKIAEANKNYLI